MTSMPLFILHHQHSAEECSATYAAWKGFDSPLRRHSARATCISGGHEIWWDVVATDEDEAKGQLPGYVAERTQVVRVGQVEIP
jgi:hypothetical protein